MNPTNLPTDLPDSRLRWGYWYVTHYTRLHKIAWWLLLAVTVILWLYVVIGLVQYVRDGIRFKQILMADTNQPPVPAAVRAAQTALPLVVQNVYTVPGSHGTIDLVAIVENPNRQWYVPELTYQFNFNGQAVGVDKTFLLPGEKKALVRMKVSGGSGSADVVLNPTWQRVRFPDKVLLPKFTIGAVQFIPAHTPTTDRPAVSFSQAIFTITNDSPFAWWSVPVTVIGKSNSSVAAVGQVVVDKFLSQEKRLLTVSWSEPIASPTSFEIYPTVDTIQASSYLDRVILNSGG